MIAAFVLGLLVGGIVATVLVCTLVYGHGDRETERLT